jgi:putative membrane protein
MAFSIQEQIASEWSLHALPLLSLVAVGGMYLRGFVLARRTRPEELPAWRAGCFFAGIASIWIAIASPIDALDDFLLTAHMIQHLILMSIAPPLLVLGTPVVPLLRGLPRWVVQNTVGPLLLAGWFQRTVKKVMHPAVAWIAMNFAYVAWHVPRAFELALHSESWHTVEHLCFFTTSLLFWWAVIQPWPSRPLWPRWSVIPLLVTADIINTAVSAFLVFYGRVLYPTYADAPRVSALTPLNDQVAAGAEMWVLGSTIFLGAAVILVWQMLRPSGWASRIFTLPIARSRFDA